jgi:hypothetical protein
MQDGKSSYIHPVEEVGLAVLAPERLMRCNPIRSNRRMPINQMDARDRGEETINK